LDNEEIIIRPARLTGEAKVFQPYGRVGVLRVLDNIRRCTETRQEWRLLTRECLWAAGIRVWAASSVPNPGMSAMVV
jgi:hypothetical protein